MLRTWDIFDTLIARRCIYSMPVFEKIREITKDADFIQQRKLAEGNCFKKGRNFDIHEIYKEYEKITGKPKSECETLKKLELDIEMEQSIPITENIRQVKAGDILISDMYLPPEFVRKLLYKAGLLAPVEIVITNNGKYTGRVYKQLADQKILIFHIGDNEKSDLALPRSFNLDSSLNIRTRPNEFEQFLLKYDRDFAQYIREIRLRNPFSEEIKRLYWNYCTMNMATLILITRQLDELQKKHGFEYLGFCGRDAHYLHMLYEKYKSDAGEEPVSNDYLYYSRKLINNSQQEVLKYFSTKIKGRKALLVDLVGTGHRLHTFRRANADLNFSLLICFHLSKIFSDTYHKTEGSVPKKWISFLDNPDEPEESDSAFYFAGYNQNESRYVGVVNEVLNRSTHNSPLRLNLFSIDDRILPSVQFSQVEDTENRDVIESCLQEVLRSKICWTKLHERELLEQLLQILSKNSRSKIFAEQQSLEDRENILIREQLKK